MMFVQKSISIEEDRSDLSNFFESIGESPIKVCSLPESSKVKQGKRKIEKAVNTMTEKVARVLDVPAEKVKPIKEVMTKEEESKLKDFDEMMDLLADKVRSLSTTKSKLQVLTLAPSNWTHKQVSEFFGVSMYLARTARTLRAEKGVLSMPDPRRSNGLSKATLDLVELFYNDDEFMRLMPGKKDCVSVGRSVYKQKRLVLCNLKELFNAFKVKYPEVKIGFSKFASLRPKWCVLAGASGTHSVCVCTIHQNVKLLLIPTGTTYKELFKFIVCDTEDRECMVQRCPNCPQSPGNLREFLFDLMEDHEQDDMIEFQQWTTTDRSNLINQREYLVDYIELVIEQLQKLTAHSYLAKAQAKYLKSRKEEMDANTALFLGDFAENYNFVVQDEVQGFHWNNKQCSLHPVLIYYRDDSGLKHRSFCILSDDLNHDVPFVYEVQRLVLDELKLKFPHITKVEYFSDGCGGQYKKRKNFLNLCLHKKDFGLDAKWHFFATSHEKQPCDGIGGTIKRLVAKASLQKDISGQILDHRSMLDFCRANISEIQFLYVDRIELTDRREMLSKRFENTYPVPGTRSFHMYEPLSSSSVGAKRCSEDKQHALKHDLLQEEQVHKKVNVFDFVACLYDLKWWIGIAMDVNDEEGDILVKFMHPNGPARSFSWPSNDDVCLVPSTHILHKLEVPTTTTGRQYTLDKADIKMISSEFLKMST